MPVSIHGAWHEISRPNQTDSFFNYFQLAGIPTGPPKKKGAIHNLALFIVEFVSARLEKLDLLATPSG